MISPHFEKASTQIEGVEFIKVDVDEATVSRVLLFRVEPMLKVGTVWLATILGNCRVRQDQGYAHLYWLQEG